jgi:hypothetical protein
MSNQMKLTHCVWISTSKPPAPVQPEIGGFLWGQPPGQPPSRRRFAQVNGFVASPSDMPTCAAKREAAVAGSN